MNELRNEIKRLFDLTPNTCFDPDRIAERIAELTKVCFDAKGKEAKSINMAALMGYLCGMDDANEFTCSEQDKYIQELSESYDLDDFVRRLKEIE